MIFKILNKHIKSDTNVPDDETPIVKKPVTQYNFEETLQKLHIPVYENDGDIDFSTTKKLGKILNNVSWLSNDDDNMNNIKLVIDKIKSMKLDKEVPNYTETYKNKIIAIIENSNLDNIENNNFTNTYVNKLLYNYFLQFTVQNDHIYNNLFEKLYKNFHISSYGRLLSNQSLPWVVFNEDDSSLDNFFSKDNIYCNIIKQLNNVADASLIMDIIFSLNDNYKSLTVEQWQNVIDEFDDYKKIPVTWWDDLA